ncbi:hypothetical protein ACFQGT_12435 [Natrialbaceae archaeon GCM10025810]|uniref:DUF7470 family protein n=1 Tax=Halovalidus salilacus TaxID=3075124 RepID=UPI00361A1047
MFDKLGPLGIVGFLFVLAGVGLVAYADPIIAVGIALVLAGLGLVVRSLISSVLSSFGMF